MTLEIPLRPTSWNSICAKNRWTYIKIKDAWQAATLAAIHMAQISRISDFPVKIEVQALWKGNRRHDVDGIYAKGVLDALVYAKVLPDDSTQYVSKVIFTGKIGQERDALIVTITHDPQIT